MIIAFLVFFGLSAISTILTIVGTFTKNRWGINLQPVSCQKWGNTTFPTFRRPTSIRQALPQVNGMADLAVYRKPFDPILNRVKNEEWCALGDDFRTWFRVEGAGNARLVSESGGATEGLFVDFVEQRCCNKIR